MGGTEGNRNAKREGDVKSRSNETRRRNVWVMQSAGYRDFTTDKGAGAWTQG